LGFDVRTKNRDQQDAVPKMWVFKKEISENGVREERTQPILTVCTPTRSAVILRLSINILDVPIPIIAAEIQSSFLPSLNIIVVGIPHPNRSKEQRS